MGMRKPPLLPMSLPLSSSWLPTFITSEMSRLAGLIQKSLFFYCRNALDKTSCSLNLCHQMEQAPPPPGGGGCSPLPVPASPTPVCLSLGCPLLKKPTCKGSLLLLPHRGPCGPVACALGGVAFSPFPLGIPD